jgi:lysine-specific permease
LGIAISHYRFRRGYEKQGRDLSSLPYRSRWSPFGPIFAFVLCLIVALGQNYQGFFDEKNDLHSLLATYIGIPLFLVIWLGYRLKKKTRFIHCENMRFFDTSAERHDNENEFRP